MSSSPRRVLHVIVSLDVGGAQTFLLGLCANLDRERYLPEVVCMHGSGVYAQAFEDEQVRLRSLSPGKFPPRYIPEFARLLLRERHDILHFHLFGANLCAKPLALIAGHPGIVVHDQCNDSSRDRNPLLLGADAFWNRRSGKVIAVSESTRRYLLDREDLPDDLVTVIPNGVDTALFRPGTPEEKVAARERLGIPRGAFVIGGIGRLVEQKNFSLFLEVVSRLFSRNADAVAVLAGTGPLEGDLMNQAARLGIRDRVRFVGHITDRPGLYHAVDVLLMTSLFEGTPLVLLEAMSSALPVVATSVDGISEVCTDAKDAFLARDFFPDSFVFPLLSLLRRESPGNDLGQNARRTIESRYGIKVITRRVEGVYENLLSGSDRDF